MKSLLEKSRKKLFRALGFLGPLGLLGILGLLAQ